MSEPSAATEPQVASVTTPSERVQRLREETAKAGWNGYCERNRTGAKVLVLLALTLDGRHSEMVHAQSGERPAATHRG